MERARPTGWPVSTSTLSTDPPLLSELVSRVSVSALLHTTPSNWYFARPQPVQAAASIGADFLSPVATAYASPVADPALPGYIPFTNKTMVDAAHRYGMQIKPWTPDTLNSIKYLLDIGVDGIITDFPFMVRRYFEQRGNYALAPLGDVARVQKCLMQHVQLAPSNRTI